MHVRLRTPALGNLLAHSRGNNLILENISLPLEFIKLFFFFEVVVDSHAVVENNVLSNPSL